MYKLVAVLLALVFTSVVAIVILLMVNKKEPETIPQELAPQEFAKAVAPDVEVLERPLDDVSLAKAQLGAFRRQIDAYKADVGHYPTPQEGLTALEVAPTELTDGAKWHGPYATSGIPPDPWGNKYLYELLTLTEYRVYSAGPDGAPNTVDDVGGSDE